MDPITHGIAGALIGKAFFAGSVGPASEEAGYSSRPEGELKLAAPTHARDVVWVATVAAMFPDADMLLVPFAPGSMGTIELHRWVTHSLLCLPVFAVLLALGARWWMRRRGGAAPSLGRFALICAVGLASHVLLDAVTSWGTMLWSPFSRQRVAWDLVFILDFTLTGILVLPQLLAWIYSQRERAAWRAAIVLALCVAVLFAVRAVTRAAGGEFQDWSVPAVIVTLAALLFVPLVRGRGFSVQRAAWCRAGVVLAVGYLAACGLAHQVALRRVEQFAAAHKLNVEDVAALPLPPSLARWSGLVRTPEGVYGETFNLFDGRALEMVLTPHSADNGFVARAKELPEVRTYLWFARFPVIRYTDHGERHTVELVDLRFFPRGVSRPAPFEYRVTLDSAGRVVENGWAE